MNATPYPLPRQTRETPVFFGNGGPGPYGPTVFKVFDTEDVAVLAMAEGELRFADVTGSVTVTKTGGLPYDTVSVLFGADIPLTTQLVIQARRTHERAVAVNKAGTLLATELEKELSKQGTVISELRRDLQRSVSFRPGATGSTMLPKLEAGQTLMRDALTDALVPGPKADAIAAAQANAVAVQQAYEDIMGIVGSFRPFGDVTGLLVPGSNTPITLPHAEVVQEQVNLVLDNALQLRSSFYVAEGLLYPGDYTDGVFTLGSWPGDPLTDDPIEYEVSYVPAMVVPMLPIGAVAEGANLRQAGDKIARRVDVADFAPRRMATIAAMRAIPKSTLQDGDPIFVSYYAVPLDQGGGQFNWIAGSVAPIDGGMVFASAEGGTGRFIRNTAPSRSNTIQMAWYGLRATRAGDSWATINANAAWNDAALLAAHVRLNWRSGEILFPSTALEGGLYFDFRQQLRLIWRSSAGLSFGVSNVRWKGCGGMNSGPRLRFIGKASECERDLKVWVGGVELTATTVKDYTSCWVRVDGCMDLYFEDINFIYASDLQNGGADKTKFLFVVDGLPRQGTSSIQWGFPRCGFEYDPATPPPAAGAMVWCLNALEGDFEKVRWDCLGVTSILFGQFYPSTFLAHFPSSAARPIAGGSVRNIRIAGGHNYGHIRYRSNVSTVTIDNMPFTCEPEPNKILEDVDATYGDVASGYNWTLIGGGYGGVVTLPYRYGLASAFAFLGRMEGLVVINPYVGNRQLFLVAGGTSRDWTVFSPKLDIRSLSNVDALAANGGVAADAMASILRVANGVPLSGEFRVIGRPEPWNSSTSPLAYAAIDDRRNGMAYPIVADGTRLASDFTFSALNTPEDIISVASQPIRKRWVDVDIAVTLHPAAASSFAFYPVVGVQALPIRIAVNATGPTDRKTYSMRRRVRLSTIYPTGTTVKLVGVQLDGGTNYGTVKQDSTPYQTFITITEID